MMVFAAIGEGPAGLITIALVFLLSGIGASKYAIPKLVLTKFQLASSPSQAELPILSLSGRRAGIVGYLLTLAGLENTVSLTITLNQAECRMTSLAGKSVSFMPLASVTTVMSSLRKPIAYLFFAILSAVGGVYAAIVGASVYTLLVIFISAGLLGVAYSLGKSVLLSVQSSGGQAMTLQFFPSVIEGVKIDEKRIEWATIVIRDLVLRSNRPAQPDSNPSHGTFAPPVTAQAVAVAVPSVPEPDYPTPVANHTAQDYEQPALKMLRDGVAMYKAGSTSQAVALFSDIMRVYPQTAAAKKAGEFMQQIRAESR